MTTAVWIFLNSQKVIEVSDTGIPYPLFVIIGSVVWQTFVKLVQCPLTAFRDGQAVFMKLKVPPEAFVASGTARAAFDFTIYSIVLIPVLLVLGIVPPSAIFLLPIALLALFTLGTAIGLLLVPLASLYSDIQQSVPIVLGFLMYMAPVVYPPPTSGWAAMAVKWNPMTPILMGTRDMLTTGNLSNIPGMLAIIFVSGGVITCCMLGIKVVMPHLVSRMGM